MACLPVKDEVVMMNDANFNVNDEDCDTFVLYKCEDCGNLFQSLDSLQDHLNTNGQCAAVDAPALANADGSAFYVDQRGGVITPKYQYGAGDNFPALGSQNVDSVRPATKRELELRMPVVAAKRGRGRGGRGGGKVRKKREFNHPIFSEPFPDAPTYPCNFCGAVFQSSRSRDSHVQVHKSQEKIACDVCKAEFSKVGELKSHRVVHTGREKDSSSICDVCGDEFSGRHLLTQHTARNHAAELAYICQHCDAAFLSEAELFVHSQKCKERPDRGTNSQTEKSRTLGQYTCGICQKMYKNIHFLTRHIAKMHNCKSQNDVELPELTEEELPCRLCYRVFIGIEALQLHDCEAVPKGGRMLRFQCNICLGKFVSDLFLDAHLLVHAERKEALNTESVVPEEESVTTIDPDDGSSSLPLEYCRKCGLIFSDVTCLSDHINDEHLGSDAFVCEECKVVFEWRSDLDEHKRQYHVSKFVYGCGVCPRRFSNVTSLNRHCEIVHQSARSVSRESRLDKNQIDSTSSSTTSDQAMPVSMPIFDTTPAESLDSVGTCTSDSASVTHDKDHDDNDDESGEPSSFEDSMVTSNGD